MTGKKRKADEALALAGKYASMHVVDDALASLPLPVGGTPEGVTADALELIEMVMKIDHEIDLLAAKRFGQVGVIEAFGTELTAIHARLHVLAVALRTIIGRAATPPAPEGKAEPPEPPLRLAAMTLLRQLKTMQENGIRAGEPLYHPESPVAETITALQRALSTPPGAP